ncbi:type III secretion protein [Pseudomonas sp. MWU16-30323]|jgi:hypothetical protein|uniref:type III secretion protein n=1 Tax=Pseudomonas sp. MWU16-30323 TaxID=2878094 RepID=UPI001CFBA7EC|nr:type III secretion protein [Pseudomonas sp. MWU16-30323]
MSVTVSNPSVANPSDNAAPRNPDAATSTLPRSLPGQGAIHISFIAPQNGAGPVYSNWPTTQSPMDPRGAANSSFPASHPNSFLGGLIGQLQSFLHKLQSMFNPFRPGPGYGRPDPFNPHRPNPGYCRPPQPGIGIPKPVRPDPDFSDRNHDTLSQMLRDNFGAFTAPGKSYITKESLEQIAGKSMTGHPATDRNIALAQALLKRPELMDALDREGKTGRLDGRITLADVNAVIRSDSPLKYQTDKQLAEQMLEKFNALKGSFRKNSISINDLKSLAASQFTGDPKRDPLIELAREVTQRSSLLTLMDALDRRYDGEIGKDALRWLSR